MQITANYPINTRILARGGKPIAAAHRHRIGIAHQDERNIGVARAKCFGDGEQIGGFGARAQAAQIGLLNGRAIGHWIGKRHPKLNHISAARDKRIKDRASVSGRGVSARDEGYEGWGGFCKSGGEAGHFWNMRNLGK